MDAGGVALLDDILGGICIVAGIYGWVMEPSTEPDTDHGHDDHTPDQPTDSSGDVVVTEEAALVD